MKTGPGAFPLPWEARGRMRKDVLPLGVVPHRPADFLAIRTIVGEATCSRSPGTRPPTVARHGQRSNRGGPSSANSPRLVK